MFWKTEFQPLTHQVPVFIRLLSSDWSIQIFCAVYATVLVMRQVNKQFFFFSRLPAGNGFYDTTIRWDVWKLTSTDCTEKSEHLLNILLEFSLSTLEATLYVLISPEYCWLKSVQFQNVVSSCTLSLFTYHAYDAGFISSKTIFLSPLHLKYPVLFLWLALLPFALVSHEFYLWNEWFYIKNHTQKITTYWAN